uniref:Selenoprotein V n=1 Tax=Aotus nancymaae TaxID=37293 RepID=A0A2K5CXE3_AOTNA
MNNQARTPAPSSARTSTSVLASTPTRTQTPVRTPTAVRTRTPIRTLTPLLTLSLAGTPALVPTPTPARISRLVPTPAPARTPPLIPTLVRTLTPVRLPAPARIPAPAPARAWAPALVLAGIRATFPVLDSYPASALPWDPPPEPAPEPLVSVDPEPAPDLKVCPVGLRPRPLPARTPAATTHRPTLDFAADSLATGLAVPPSLRVPIRVTYLYILLKKNLEQRFPDRLLFEEDRAAQATGDFEVFVGGKLVHSKKRGDGFVDEAKLQKIVNVIDEEIKKR